jgi:hypothetical protein
MRMEVRSQKIRSQNASVRCEAAGGSHIPSRQTAPAPGEALSHEPFERRQEFRRNAAYSAFNSPDNAPTEPYLRT